ncbi:MAG: DUF1003 domain-containing protein [Polyangiaceae bacterium]|nr:DUF1003 domain-containing protein [Polyangiaceae bacterium]
MSARPHHESVPCAVCGKPFGSHELRSVAVLRPNIRPYLENAAGHPLPADARACAHCLNAARVENVVERLERERGELSAVDADVARRAAQHAPLDEAPEANLSFGQALADRVARVGGSWPFVIGFLIVLVAWMALNTVVLATRAFDPFPYILLNLVLSCVAAIQAPVIMMSQNRSAVRDRAQAEQDYRVNLKAELEIALLHEKMDHLLHTQWEHMAEIQRTQLELLEQLSERSPASSRG